MSDTVPDGPGEEPSTDELRAFHSYRAAVADRDAALAVATMALRDVYTHLADARERDGRDLEVGHGQLADVVRLGHRLREGAEPDPDVDPAVDGETAVALARATAHLTDDRPAVGDVARGVDPLDDPGTVLSGALDDALAGTDADVLAPDDDPPSGSDLSDAAGTYAYRAAGADGHLYAETALAKVQFVRAADRLPDRLHAKADLVRDRLTTADPPPLEAADLLTLESVDDVGGETSDETVETLDEGLNEVLDSLGVGLTDVLDARRETGEVADGRVPDRDDEAGSRDDGGPDQG